MSQQPRLLRWVGCVACLGIAAAMRGSDEYDVDPGVFGRWQEFGFLAGGSAVVHTRVSSPENLPGPPAARLWTMACTYDQFQWLLNADPGSLCRSNVNMSDYCWQATLMGNGSNGTSADNLLSVAVTWSGFGEFLLLSCGHVRMSVTLDWHFTNPGGEELSSGAIPIKPVTEGFAVAWGVVAALVLLNMCVSTIVYYRTRAHSIPAATSNNMDAAYYVEPAVLRPVRPLHYAIFGVAMLMSVSSVASLVFWRDVSATGVVDNGRLWISIAVMDTAAACLIGLILLLSRGWQITRLSVESYEWRHVVFMVFLYVISWVSWQIMGQFFWLFALVLTYVLMLRYLFASVSWRLRLLQSFRAFVRLMSAPSREQQEADAYSAEASATGSTALPTTSSEYTMPPLRSQAEAESEQASLLAPGPAPVPVQRSLLSRARFALGGWWTSVAQTPEQHTLSVRQIRALVHFRTAILVYLTLDVMSQVWNALALSQQPWIGVVINDLWSMLMVLYLFYLFRASANPKTSVLYDPREYAGASYEQLLESANSPVGATADGAPRRLVVQNPDGTVPVLAELAQEARRPSSALRSPRPATSLTPYTMASPPPASPLAIALPEPALPRIDTLEAGTPSERQVS